MTTDAAPAPFEATTTRLDDTITMLTVRGEVDMTTSPRLTDIVDSVLSEDPTTALIVDLTDVSFLSSSGINVLIDTRASASQQRSFAVVADGPHTARPLMLLGLADTFTIHPDRDTAIAAMRADRI